MTCSTCSRELPGMDKTVKLNIGDVCLRCYERLIPPSERLHKGTE